MYQYKVITSRGFVFYVEADGVTIEPSGTVSFWQKDMSGNKEISAILPVQNQSFVERTDLSNSIPDVK